MTFTQPIKDGVITLATAKLRAVPGMVLFHPNGGYYRIEEYTGGQIIKVSNLGLPQNALPGTEIEHSVSSFVVSGEPGVTVVLPPAIRNSCDAKPWDPGTANYGIQICLENHGFKAGDALKVSTDTSLEFELADATSFDARRTVGLVTHVIDDNTFVLIEGGFVKFFPNEMPVWAPSGFTQGIPYYLSDTPGELSTTPGTVEKVLFVGYEQYSGFLDNFDTRSKDGATGATGPIGPTGATGVTGPTGATGPEFKVYVDPNPPTGAINEGDLWLDSDDVKLSAYYDNTWVEIGAGPQGAQGATGATGVVGPIGPSGATGATGADGDGVAYYGQVSRMTNGTINVATAGTYQSTGLTATLDSEAYGIALGTSDSFAVKNTSGETVLYKIYASADITAGNTNLLGIKLALNGTPIDTTECRASTGTGANTFAKLVTNWMIELAPNDEVALFVTNHTASGNMTLNRGRVVASTVGRQGDDGATGVTGATGVIGATGVQGATGATGETGATGVQGPIGATGATGVIGLQGVTGATGVAGPTGATGIQGATGPTGPIGATGADGTGTAYYGEVSISNENVANSSINTWEPIDESGADAVLGDAFGIGLTGEAFGLKNTSGQTLLLKIDGFFDITSANLNVIGLQFFKGLTPITSSLTYASTGTSTDTYANLATSCLVQLAPNEIVFAYISNATAGNNMLVRYARLVATTPGKEGNTGATGVTGATGPQGATGAVGATGATGAVGATGIQGPTGAIGATGAVGATGATGVAGATGATGATGNSGVDAIYPPLVNFGTSQSTYEPVYSTIFPPVFSQTSTTANVNGSVTVGDLFSVLVTPTITNWTPYLNQLKIVASITGTNPNVPILLEVYNSDLEVVDEWSGYTTGLTSSPGIITLTKNNTFSNSALNIAGLAFYIESSTTINLTLHSVVANSTITGQTGATGVTGATGAIGATGATGPAPDLSSPPPIGNVTPNTAVFTTLSANNGTITSSSPVLDLAQTWNDSGTTFVGALLNITATANSTSSNYFEIQRSGVTQFAVTASSANIPMIELGGGGFRTRIRGRTSAGVGVNFEGILGVNTRIELGVGATTGSGDVNLSREAADTLAIFRGTNPQTFRLYNTYTDASNYERLNLRWASNEFIINAEAEGTGTLRGIKIGSATSSLLGFYGVTPVDQPATVTDPTGGVTQDAEARTAINAIIDRLQELGLIA